MERSEGTGLSAASNAPVGIVAFTRWLSLSDGKYNARKDNARRLKLSRSDGASGHPPSTLRPPRFLPSEDFMAFAIEDPDADRLGRPLYVCGGDDGGGSVRHFNLLLRQIGRPAVDRPANKLNPECPLRLRNDLGWRIRLGKRRTRSLNMSAPGRPPRDDQGDPSPVSRRLIATGLTFAAPSFRVSLVAKRMHKRARSGAYSLGPLQLPQQPRKHIRPSGLDAEARLAMPIQAAARRYPNGCAIFAQSH
jgi:hypothetical protein